MHKSHVPTWFFALRHQTSKSRARYWSCKNTQSSTLAGEQKCIMLRSSSDISPNHFAPKLGGGKKRRREGGEGEEGEEGEIAETSWKDTHRVSPKVSTPHTALPPQKCSHKQKNISSLRTTVHTRLLYGYHIRKVKVISRTHTRPFYVHSCLAIWLVAPDLKRKKRVRMGGAKKKNNRKIEHGLPLPPRTNLYLLGIFLVSPNTNSMELRHCTEHSTVRYRIMYDRQGLCDFHSSCLFLLQATMTRGNTETKTRTANLWQQLFRHDIAELFYVSCSHTYHPSTDNQPT